MDQDQPFQTISVHTSDINSCVFGKGGNLASCSSDKKINIYNWKINEGFVKTDFSPLGGQNQDGHRYSVTCLDFSKYGTILASGSIDSQVILWDTQNGSKLQYFIHPGSTAIRVVNFSFTSSLLLSGSDSGVIVVWDLSQKKLLKTLLGHEESVYAASFLPDEGNYVLSGCSYGLLNLYDLNMNNENTIKPIYTVESAHDLGVTSLDFSKNVISKEFGQEKIYTLVTAGQDNLVKLWGVHITINLTGLETYIEPLFELLGHSSSVMCVRVSGPYILSASGDKSLRLWDLKKGDCVKILKGHDRYVTSCAFNNPDHPLLIASGSNDKKLLIYDLTNGSLNKSQDFTEWHNELALKNPNLWAEYEKLCKKKLIQDGIKCTLLQTYRQEETSKSSKSKPIPKNDFNSCALVNENIIVASCPSTKSLLAWNIDTNKQIKPAKYQFAINQLDYSHHIKLLAAATSEGYVYLFNYDQKHEKFTKTQQIIHHPSGGTLRFVRFSDDGEYLVTGGDDEKGTIWSTKTYALVRELNGHISTIFAGVFSPNGGQFVVTGDADGKLKLWTTINKKLNENENCLDTVLGHELGVLTIDFSPHSLKSLYLNGCTNFLLGSAGNDSLIKLFTIKLWHVNSDITRSIAGSINICKIIDNHGTSSNILTLKFSPSGFLLYSGSSGDNYVRIFEVSSGEFIEGIGGHERSITSIVFGEDKLISSSSDGTSKLWKLNGELEKKTFKISDDSTNLIAEKLISEWSILDVSKFLQDIGQKDDKIINQFISNGINGSKLILLNELSNLDFLSGCVESEVKEKILSEIKWLKILGRQEVLSRSKSSIHRPSCPNISVKPEFICPITHEVMVEPVTTSDMHNYERKAITEWFLCGKVTSPMTNEELSSLVLTPNFKLQNEISEFLAQSLQQ